MYPSDNDSKIVLLAHIPVMENDFPLFAPNGEEPLVVSFLNKIYLIYKINHRVPGTPVEDLAIITFQGTNYRRGWPNEQGLNKHPLAKNGLNAYTISEVINSSWIKQIIEYNSHNPSEIYKTLRHFIFAFHDSMFECIARDYKIETRNGKFGDILNEFSQNPFFDSN
jgi:hypothetical protein